MTTMKFSALQMDISFEDPDKNFRSLDAGAHEASEAGVDVLITPETFSSGFTMNSDVAIDAESRTLTTVSNVARKYGMHIIAGVHRRLSDGRPANVAIVVNRKGELIHEYAKTHLFSPLNEHVHYSAGNGPEPFEIEGIRVGLGICYDIRFPECFRFIARSVDVVVVIANWPKARQRHWDTLLQARAIENQTYVIGVNRVGTMGDIEYDGGTAVISPYGDVLSRLSGRVGQLVESINSNDVFEARTTFPFLSDIKLIDVK